MSIGQVLFDIVHGNINFCCLCYQGVQENVIWIDDEIYIDSQDTQTMSKLLEIIFGEDVLNSASAFGTFCDDCKVSLVNNYKFKKRCKGNLQNLNSLISSVSESFENVLPELENFNTLFVTVDLHDFTTKQFYDDTNVDQLGSLKVENLIKMQKRVDENESKVILMNKEQNKAPQEKPVSEKRKLCNDYQCDKCKQTFTNEFELTEHAKSGHIFECPDCDQHRCSEKGLKEHQDKAHTIYVCQECGKSCRGLDKLAAHEKRHGSSKLRCPKCDKTYLTQNSYARHVELCLAEKLEAHPYRGKYEKTYFCEKCGKGYSTQGGLRVHERFVHGNAKPHICEQCGKKFTAPSYLKTHMVKHTGEKNFNCNICSKNFVSKEALLYHTRRHTGEKPFSCNLCNERFVNASSRAEHIKFKHTGPTLTCDICQRKFFTSSFLKHHKKRHFDPVSKLYAGRSMMPPNMPGEQNIRIKKELLEMENFVILKEES